MKQEAIVENNARAWPASRSLKIKAVYTFKRSGTDYPVTWRDVPEEQSPVFLLISIQFLRICI
jgi:hypothetical protein